MIDENAIIAAITALLEGILNEDDEQVIKEVHDVVPAQYQAYPAAYVVPVSWGDELADLRDTINNMVFRIVVVYTLDPDMELGQKKVRDTAKLVREVLASQENIELGGLVDWSKATGGTYGYDTKEQKVAFCQIDLQVRKRFNRFS